MAACNGQTNTESNADNTESVISEVVNNDADEAKDIESPIEDPLTISKDGDSFTGSNGIAKIEQISDTFLEVTLLNNTKRYYAMKKDETGNLILLECACCFIIFAYYTFEKI